MKKIAVSILLLAVILIPGCTADDPYPDDVYYDGAVNAYSANITYLETALTTTSAIVVNDTLAVLGYAEFWEPVIFDEHIDFDLDGRYYDQLVMPIQVSRTIASGKPTVVNRGVYRGFSLPIWNAGGNSDEEIYACACVPEAYDQETDMVLYIGGWLDTANTDKKFNLRVSFNTWASGEEVPDTVIDVDVETDTETAAQFQGFKVAVTIPEATLSRGDALGIRVRRIDATADEIAGEFVLDGMVLLYSCYRLGAYDLP